MRHAYRHAVQDRETVRYRAAAPPAPGGQKTASPPVPFRAGVQPAELVDYSNTTTLSGNAQNLPVYNVTPNVWQRGFWILTQIAFPGNAVATLVLQTATPFAGQNYPFSIWNTITFSDINSKAIVGGATFSGYDLHVANKYFGFLNLGDSRAAPGYSATLTGTPTAHQFAMYLPLEVATRTGLGSLENKSTASTFKLQLTVESQVNLFSTPPTNPAVVTTRITSDSYFSAKVPGTASAPPAAGATQYLIKGSYPGLSGSQSPIIQQGLGYPLRNLALVNYDVTNGTRATGDTDFPDPLQMIYLGTAVFSRIRTLWQERMARYFFYTNVAKDAALGLENGVYAIWYNGDFGLDPGDELGNAYLPTEAGSLLQFIGTWTGNSNLYVIANYIAAPNNNVASLRAGGR
jgi:hypothetical protein